MEEFSTILFVHIPKTAGTSFRMAARRALGDRIAFDYGPKGRNTSPLVREHLYPEGTYPKGESPDELAAYRRMLIEHRIVMTGGHLRYERFAGLFPPEQVITILRDPVARIVSHYHHEVRKGTAKGTVLEFCEERRRRNVQSRLLRGAPLRRLCFGITERYAESIELLQQRLGVPLVRLHENQKPSGATDRDALPQDVIDTIRAWNQKDVTLYERASTLFERRLQRLRRGRRARSEGE
jgi:hypothetical protein